MNALRIIAFLTLGLAVAHSKGTKPNHRIVSKVKAQDENDCVLVKSACESAAGCYWDNDGEGGLCGVDDGATLTSCCEIITSSPTPEPTSPPTCASTMNRGWECSWYNDLEDCCDTVESCIYYPSTDSCQTTPAPTTASPTTAEPTTAEPTQKPTTDAPTTAEPTTAEPTQKPTTDAPTTDAPTTSEPTKKPTTDAPTTAAPTTSAPTPDVEIPTPNPTMHSAAKWEMLHPSYKGGDGELMWQVYYGDFSDDARFDDFRKEQLWDADVIRPIIDEDAKFERYQAVAVEAHSSSTSSIAQYMHSPYLWALFASLAVMSALVFWCRSRDGGYAKLADSETDLLLDSTRKQNGVYSN